MSPVRLAEDRVSRKLVRSAIAFVIAGSLAFSGWALLLHRGAEARHAVPQPPPRQAPGQISEVRQTLIRGERPGQVQIRLGREALSRWSWVDRGQGIVAMPVEEAMRLVEQEGGGLQ